MKNTDPLRGFIFCVTYIATMEWKSSSFPCDNWRHFYVQWMGFGRRDVGLSVHRPKMFDFQFVLLAIDYSSVWFQCHRDRGSECRHGLGKSQVFIGLSVWFKLALMCCVLEQDNYPCHCSPLCLLISNSFWHHCWRFSSVASLAY